jgi:hypothetical protein
MFTHLAQRDAFRQLVAHQLRRGGGEQDLPTMSGGHDACRTVQRRTEIIAVTMLCYAGVQAHP